MADSKYSAVNASLDSFELPTFSVASEPFGLSGFRGALAQLGMALNSVSLDIRLLTASQGKLGEALASLTTAFTSPPSLIKALPRLPGGGSEATPGRNAAVEPRSPSTAPWRSMAIELKTPPCTCDLKSLIHAQTDHQTVPPLLLPFSEKRIDNALEKSRGAEFGKTPPASTTLERKESAAQPPATQTHRAPASADGMDASLGRLRSSVTPDFSDGISTQVDKLSSFAEENPIKATGLAAVAVVLYSIASKLVESVIDEAFTNVAKKILKRGAPRLPFGLGNLVDEDDRGGNGGNPGQNDGQREQRDRAGERRRSKAFKSPKKAANPPPRNSPQQRIEVRPRTMVPAVAQPRNLVSLVSPAQVNALPGRLASAGSFLGKRAQPLRLLDAGIGMAQGVANRDAKAVASSAGVLAGSYAGATAGAAIGTLIFPGVGTAIGGLLGGFAGSELGSMLGEKLGVLADRLSAPQQVSKDLVSAQTQSSPINFSPSIQVTCTTPDSTEQIRMVVEQQLQAQFHGEFVPLMSTNALATRRDAALTDGGV